MVKSLMKECFRKAKVVARREKDDMKEIKAIIPHPHFPPYAVESPKAIYRVRKCFGRGFVKNICGSQQEAPLWIWSARIVGVLTLGGLSISALNWVFTGKSSIRDLFNYEKELQRISKLKKKVARVEEQNKLFVELIETEEAAITKLKVKKGWFK
ncbi:uncharacterized protein LOC135149320 [Daucus carota subsp. sativus]|uniref:uncharacterized protein LOC135149320 n=1 Tax=Daucus carota subsp. sativus TaxID=79200 RepID=UPI0030828C7F